jgi:hypothetical protein
LLGCSEEIGRKGTRGGRRRHQRLRRALGSCPKVER